MKLPTGQVLSSSDIGLLSNQTLTASQNGNPMAPQKNILICHLVVGTVTGTSPSLTVKFQDSADGVNWVDIPSGAFTAVTASSQAQRLVLTNIGDMVRAVATISGTTPSFAGVTLTALER